MQVLTHLVSLHQDRHRLLAEHRSVEDDCEKALSIISEEAESDDYTIFLNSSSVLTPPSSSLLSGTETSFHLDSDLIDYETLEMSTSWSSAATGKPQLSYAERLRKAKGDSIASSDASTTKPMVQVLRSVGEGSSTLQSMSVEASPSPMPQSPVPSTGVASSPSVSTSLRATSLDTSVAASASAESLPSTAAPPNIWEARKKLMQEKEIAKQVSGNEDTPENRSEATGSGDARVSPNDVKSSIMTTESNFKQKERSVLFQEIPRRNGSETITCKTDPQVLLGSIPSSAGRDVGRSSRIANGMTSSVLLPATSTEYWPSPDKALMQPVGPKTPVDAASRTDAHDHKEQQQSRSSPLDSLKDLDIEVLTSAQDKRKGRGKQWISIVPTITHTAPLPAASGKLKASKGRAESTPSRRDSRAARLPTSPPLSEASLLSPRQSRLTLEQASHPSQRSNSMAAPLPQPHTMPSSPINSPILYSAGGNVRGPRFSDSRSNGSKDRASKPAKAVSIGGGVSPVRQTPQSDPIHLPLDKGSYFPSSGRLITEEPRHFSVSGASSPRGSRGRGSSRRIKTSGEASGADSSSSKTDQDERGLPSHVPTGPRHQEKDGRAHPTSRGEGNRGPTHAYYREPSAAPYEYAYPPPFPFSPPSLPMYVPAGYSYPNPGSSPAPQSERTRAEDAPQGDESKMEPSMALLHQIEFYFSHRNLEGDFFLRKNMDAQGFVSIAVVANFNKVKRLTESVDVVKATLVFSKVLEMDAEREHVRKAIGWHLYPLLEGERPLQALSYGAPFVLQFAGPFPGPQMMPPPGAFTSPHPHPFPHSTPYHQPFNTAALPNGLNGHASGEQQLWSMHKSQPQHGRQYNQPARQQQQHQQRKQRSQHHQSHQQQQKLRNGLQEGHEVADAIGADGFDDNDDDEEVLGIVAAEGLGGALRL